MTSSMRKIALLSLLPAALALAASGCHQRCPTYTLKITFSGAVAFAPADKAKRHIWALLPAGDCPDQRRLLVGKPWGDGDQRLYINLHQPEIQVARKYLGDDGPYGDTPVFFSLASARALAPQVNLADFHGHDISFDEPFDGSGISSDLSKVPFLGDPEDTNDPHRKLDPSVLSTPDETYVRARLLLTTGSLTGTEPLAVPIYFGSYQDPDHCFGYSNQDKCEKHFKEGHKLYPNMAQAAEANLLFHQAPLHLVLTTFDGTQVQRIALQPVHDEIDIAILNLPADEFLGREDSYRHSNDHPISDHFLLYYLLSAERHPPYTLPEAKSHNGQPYCGVSQFSPPY